MEAKQAVDWLDPQKWRATTAVVKLQLLKQVQANLRERIDELALSDLAVKGIPADNDLYAYQAGIGYQSTTVPVGNVIAATIELYESLKDGAMLEPLEVREVRDGRFDVLVFPRSAQAKALYGDRRDYLRVRGQPTQTNPLDKPGGIIAVLGAGNYSSSIEMVNGLFLENCAVVHRPHHLNEPTDQIWATIFKPLVDHHALSFCESQGGRVLTLDKRVDRIYFTGGAATARTISESTDTEMVTECGGNNPCIIVPGDKPWSQKQLVHQAMHIATMAKVNGGAICGRPQTLVTSRRWPQRGQFLAALEQALVEDTPAASTYYPGSDDVYAEFLAAHPEAKVLQPEHGRLPKSKFVLIPDVGVGGYAVSHEAFCQILDEVALNVPADADVFLAEAVDFCNRKLLGTLASTILIDDDTAKHHDAALQDAIAELAYGTVGVNTMPPVIFLSPWLTWGGSDADEHRVSGHGNFGNTLNIENVEKSIAYSDFMSAGHPISDHKGAWLAFSRQAARYAAHPTWVELAALMGISLAGRLRQRDF